MSVGKARSTPGALLLVGLPFTDCMGTKVVTKTLHDWSFNTWLRGQDVCKQPFVVESPESFLSFVRYATTRRLCLKSQRFGFSAVCETAGFAPYPERASSLGPPASLGPRLSPPKNTENVQTHRTSPGRPRCASFARVSRSWLLRPRFPKHCGRHPQSGDVVAVLGFDSGSRIRKERCGSAILTRTLARRARNTEPQWRPAERCCFSAITAIACHFHRNRDYVVVSIETAGDAPTLAI